MITRRTLLLFNFATGAAFVVFGWLSTYTIETLLPNVGKTVVTPMLNQSMKKEIEEEGNIDKLRERAHFYFDVSLGLKQATAGEEQRLLEGGRYACYVLAALFALGGTLVLGTVQLRSKSPEAAPVPQTPPAINS